jgi:hypothetical protein
MTKTLLFIREYLFGYFMGNTEQTSFCFHFLKSHMVNLEQVDHLIEAAAGDRRVLQAERKPSPVG